MTEFRRICSSLTPQKNAKMQNAKMYSWPRYHQNTVFYNAINPCSSYFKIRNSLMKLDCVVFKDVERFFFILLHMVIVLCKSYAEVLFCLRISSSEQLLSFYFMEPGFCNDNFPLFTLTVRKLKTK